MAKGDFWLDRKEIVAKTGAITIEGFDDCLVGTSVGLTLRFVYDAQKIMEKIAREQNVSKDEAWEIFECEFVPSYLDSTKHDPLFYYPF